MVTAAPGWEVIPGTNQVRPIGSASSVNNPNAAIIAPTATPTNTSITHTSSTPVPTPQPTYTAPTPTYTGPVNNSINNTPAGNALVQSNQQQAAALGVSIPGVGGGNTNPQTTSGVLPTSTQTPTTYPGIINALTTASTQGSPAAQSLTGQTAAASQGAIDAGSAQQQEAYKLAQQYQAQLLASQQAQAKALAQNANNPVSMDLKYGEGGALQNLYLQQQTAISNALAGESNLGQQGVALSGQGITGLGTATGSANTQQGQVLSGLGAAGGLAAPILGAPGQTNYGIGGGTGGLTPEVMQQYAQLRATGQESLIPGAITGNAVLNAQVTAAAKQINPSYNANTAAGQAGIQQSIPALVAADTAAKGIQQQITSYLKQNPTINSSTANAANAVKQWVQGQQLSDPRYQTLVNYLAEYTNTLAPLLGVGGDPTNLKTEIAQGFINAASQGQTISAVLQNISTLADAKIANLQSGASGGGVVSAPTPTAGTPPLQQGSLNLITTSYGSINPNL